MLILFLSGASVFNLLPLTFYGVKGGSTDGLQSWLSLLKEENLDSLYVTNDAIMQQYLLSDELRGQWYYLGQAIPDSQ